jgi:hypothetical protein
VTLPPLLVMANVLGPVATVVPDSSQVESDALTAIWLPAPAAPTGVVAPGCLAAQLVTAVPTSAAVMIATPIGKREVTVGVIGTILHWVG